MKPLRKREKLNNNNYTAMLVLERILVNFGVPVFICVVLPVLVVWLVARTKQNEANRKADIMLKAIEAGVPVDMEQFKSTKKAPKTIKQDLLEKLTGACVTTFMGVGFLAYALAGYLDPVWIAGKMFTKLSPVAGCVLLAVGIALFISYFVGKKLLANEIEAEEKALNEPKE